MSLQVWLPLNNNLKNQGLADITVTTSTSPVFKDYGKIGGKCLDLSTRVAFNCPALSGVTTFSVAFWVKLEDDSSITTNWQDIISFADQKADNSGTGVLRAETCYGNTNYNGVHWHDNAGYCMSKSGETLPTHYSGDRGIWHHCVMTIDSNKEVKSYTDGVLLGTYVASGGGHLTGAFHLGENNLIVGGIADVRIWDEVISMVEVKQISQGLVLHYKLSGIGGENILTNTRKFIIPTGGNGLTTDTFNDFIIRHLTARSGSSYRELAFYNNYVPVESGGSYTQSFWAKGSGKLRCHFYGGNIAVASNKSSQGVTTSATDGNIEITLSSDWKRYWVVHTLKTSSDTPTNKHILLRVMDGNEVYVCGWKLEKGDKATPWIPNSADTEHTALGFNDGIEYDCSGFGNNGTKIGELTYTTDTPRYTTSTHISAKTQKIYTTNFPTSGFGNSYTFAWWGKRNDNSPMFWGFADGIRLNGMYTGRLWNTGDSGNNPLYNIGTTTQVTAPVNNVWHHYAMTGNGTKCYVYLDGQLWAEAKTCKAISGTSFYINGWNSATDYCSDNTSISDFRIYATALSADDILTLYNTAATIDNQGNLFTYEVVEG